MPDRKELQAERLRMVRFALDFAEQKDFAKELGVAKNTLNAMETGKRPVSPTVAFRLREKYGISLDWTYYGDDTGLTDRIRRKLRKSA